jgi:hypothetical protein
MECPWKVPPQESRRPFGPSRLLLADVGPTSFARCSAKEESEAATSSALESVGGHWILDRQTGLLERFRGNRVFLGRSSFNDSNRMRIH